MTIQKNNNKNFKYWLKRLAIALAIIVSCPILYGLIAYILSIQTVERKQPFIIQPNSKLIFLQSNGVHLDIVISTKDATPSLKHTLSYHKSTQYLSFGWGDENFYLNTPTWNDLSFKTAFKALLLKSTSLVHVTQYSRIEPDWVTIPVSNKEFLKLNDYIQQSFTTNLKHQKIIVNNAGYTTNDDFYQAKGSYSMFNTCNTWVNNGFKYSGLKASVWTPFDFGLMKHYQP